jgi:hypothetical protein
VRCRIDLAPQELLMYETFESLRQKVHRHFVLQVRTDVLGTAFGNEQNVRQGIDRLIGIAGARAGIPFPPTCGVTKTDKGFPAALHLGDEALFAVNTWDGGGEEAFMRLSMLLNLMPIKFFGVEQAIRWVEVASFRHADLVDAARAALNDPTGYQSFSKILMRLVEERVPLTEVETILQAIASAAPVSMGDEALWALVEDIRVALKESSAAYYMQAFGPEACFHAASALVERLDEPGAQDSLVESLGKLQRASIVVVDRASDRRKLWEALEGLMAGQKLLRPALVLKPAEMPATVQLPPMQEILLAAGTAAAL